MKRFLLLFLVMISILLCGNVNADINDGLVAYYPLNGNAYDFSGYCNDGIEKGGIDYTDGVFGQAVSFDGIKDYIRIPQSSNINFDINDDFTISLFLSGEHVNSGEEMQTVMAKGNWGTSYPFNIRLKDKSDKGWLNAQMYDDNLTTDNLNPVVDRVFSHDAIEDTNWHHVVLEKKDTQFLRLYIDGVLVDEDNNFKVQNIYNESDLFIGATEYGNSYGAIFFMDGKVDDIKIYNRALSSAEVNLLYDPVPEGSTMLSLISPQETPDVFYSEFDDFGKLEFENTFYSNRDTVVIIHGWNTDENRIDTLPDWVTEMGQAIDTVDDVNVLYWNWQEYAYNDLLLGPGKPQDFVPGEALALGRELDNLFKTLDYENDTHLIGHSLGSGIAARTTQLLQSNYDIKRLTLLDGPVDWILDADVHLDTLLGNIKSSTYIENYVSQWGRYLVGGNGNLYNYGLDPVKFNNTEMSAHSWVHEWFTSSTRVPIDPFKINAGYQITGMLSDSQLFYQSEEYAFERNSFADNGYGYLVQGIFDNSQILLSQTDLDWTATGTAWKNDGGVYGRTNSPVYLMSEIFLPEEAFFLSFDLSILKWNEGDEFRLFWDDVLLLSFLTDLFGEGGWHQISNIDISQWAGTTGILSFGLIAQGEGVHSEFGIRNLEITDYGRAAAGPVPEPTTMLLFGIGLLGLAGVNRKKK